MPNTPSATQATADAGDAMDRAMDRTMDEAFIVAVPPEEEARIDALLGMRKVSLRFDGATLSDLASIARHRAMNRGADRLATLSMTLLVREAVRRFIATELSQGSGRPG